MNTYAILFEAANTSNVSAKTAMTLSQALNSNT